MSTRFDEVNEDHWTLEDALNLCSELDGRYGVSICVSCSRPHLFSSSLSTVPDTCGRLSCLVRAGEEKDDDDLIQSVG